MWTLWQIKDAVGGKEETIRTFPMWGSKKKNTVSKGKQV